MQGKPVFRAGSVERLLHIPGSEANVHLVDLVLKLLEKGGVSNAQFFRTGTGTRCRFEKHIGQIVCDVHAHPPQLEGFAPGRDGKFMGHPSCSNRFSICALPRVAQPHRPSRWCALFERCFEVVREHAQGDLPTPAFRIVHHIRAAIVEIVQRHACVQIERKQEQAHVPNVAHYLRSMRDVYGSRVFHGAEAQRCLQLVERAQRPVLVAHRSPDGDAVGSTLGLWHALVAHGMSAHVVLPDTFPAFYRWMPAVESIVFHDEQPEEAEALVRGADLVFCCDFNALNRVGGLEAALRQTEGLRVLLDHHLHPEDAFDLVFSDTSVCSTSELVYGLLEAWGWTDGLNRSAAECLYVGMVTDSGSFRFPAVSPSTHRIAARLLDAGVEQAVVHARVYDTNSEHRMRLLGYALGEKLRVFPAYHAAMIALSRAELDRFQARSGDTEGLVNEALRIEGINLAAFFSEAPDGKIKLSLRSRGSFSVREVAAEHFNGGGHFNAAGGAVEGASLQEVCAQFEALLPGYAHALAYEI